MVLPPPQSLAATQMLEGFSGHLARIDQHLLAALPDSSPEPLKSALHYAISAGGKRLRPLLTVVTCEMLGGEINHALSTASAIEMVHTYSLIHDDLPAMDDDDLRRGKPTLHIVYDEAIAILAGDALQSLAFQLVASEDQLPSDVKVKLVQLLAAAIGPTGMVAGQVLDMANENQSIDAGVLTETHNRKTGDLISVAITAGALIAGANEDEQACLKQFGYLLGLAFQIRDDLLDVIGTTEQLGKPQGSDAAQNKNTYTSIYGVSGAEAQLKQVREQALAALKPLDNRASVLADLTHFVSDRLT